MPSDPIKIVVRQTGIRLVSARGLPGSPGNNGVGVPAGGTAGQVLEKINNSDYATQWVIPATLALSENLQALDALTGTGWAKRTGANTWELSTAIPWTSLSSVPSWISTATAAGIAIVDAADAAAQRVSMGVSYGSASGTVCQGNDSRLSDARTPTDASVTTAKLAAGFTTLLVPAVSTSSTVALNWATALEQLIRHDVSAHTTISETGTKTPGSLIQVRMKNTSAGSIDLTWPSGWLIYGSALPTAIPAGQRVTVSALVIDASTVEAIGQISA